MIFLDRVLNHVVMFIPKATVMGCILDIQINLEQV